MTPKKYPQNFHTKKKIFIFLKTPKNIEIQKFDPKKMVRAYVCMKISEYPPLGRNHTYISFRPNDIASTKIYDNRDDFDFEIVNFPFLDGHVPRSASYGVYISQLVPFARASSYFADFNTRNQLLTQKLLKQGYRYHKLRKTFSKIYRRYYDLISKFQVGLKSLFHQGLSEPDFYGDLVYKLKKIVGSNNFSAHFIRIIYHYKKIGYNINVLQKTTCLVVNPITVGNFAFLFNCTLVGRT